MSEPKLERVNVTNENELMTLGLNLSGLRFGGNRNSFSFGSTAYFKRHAGQLIYGKQNFFHGSIALVPKEFDGKCTSGDVPAFDIHDIHDRFLYYYIAKPEYYEPKEAESTGTGSKRIHQKTLFEFPIFVPPSLAEQKKIGSLFQKLDGVISLCRVKEQKLCAIKKALLQKMFASQDRRAPDLRFAGFADEWQERKLGEVGKTFTGLSGKTSEDFGHGNA